MESKAYTVKVTLSLKSGDPAVYTGTDAANLAASLDRRDVLSTEPDFIKLAHGDGTTDYINLDCICGVKVERIPADKYVKPECEGLFCPEKPAEPETPPTEG